MTIQTATLTTARDFAAMGDIGRAELVRGRIIYLTKPKPRHGRIAMRIGAAISNFVTANHLGEVYAAETGFVTAHDPDTVRAPDVAFVRRELVAGHNEDQWFPHSPDLAVEVLSPSERDSNVNDEVQLWLDGGGRSVWLIDPAIRTATIHRADGTTEQIKEHEDLRDDFVLPGFSMPLRTAFERS